MLHCNGIARLGYQNRSRLYHGLVIPVVDARFYWCMPERVSENRIDKRFDSPFFSGCSMAAVAGMGMLAIALAPNWPVQGLSSPPTHTDIRPMTPVVSQQSTKFLCLRRNVAG